MRQGVSPRSDERQTLISIDGILRARPQQPVATTRGRGWGGVTLDMHNPYFNCAERYAGLDHHLICYCPAGLATLIQTRAGRVHSGVVSAGISFIMPAGHESGWEGNSGLSARLRIPTALVAAAAEQLGPHRPAQVEIRNVFEVRDPVIERLALTLLAEIDLPAHPAQRLLVDAVSTAIAAHLLRRYNAYEVMAPPPAPALGPADLARLVAYIEDNIHSTIGLADLAALVNVSRFHFTRLFKRSTGHTAISFVETCRIRRAQALIRETDLPLAQIAQDTGFADQSHFTRRFHRQVGCTPTAFARQHGCRRSGRGDVP